MTNIRRSLTITQGNDEKVQHARSMFLGLPQHPIDMDYTTMVNLLLELGDLLLRSDLTKPQTAIESSKVFNIIGKYAVDTAIKDDALGDQFQDYLIKNLGKVLETYQRAQQPQLSQNQPPAQYQKQNNPITYSR
jgi:hypothetical protein